MPAAAYRWAVHTRVQRVAVAGVGVGQQRHAAQRRIDAGRAAAAMWVPCT